MKKNVFHILMIIGCMLFLCGYSTKSQNYTYTKYNFDSPVIFFPVAAEEKITTSDYAQELINEQVEYIDNLNNYLQENRIFINISIIQFEIVMAEQRIDYYTDIYKKLKNQEEKEVARIADEKAKKETNEIVEEYIEEETAIYSASQFCTQGVINWENLRWTWYSQKVLPGDGLSIPGRHVDENGYVCDENDYICLASSTLSKGTVLDTPFGKQGKIYDSGCAAGTIDVYVNW